MNWEVSQAELSFHAFAFHISEEPQTLQIQWQSMYKVQIPGRRKGNNKEAVQFMNAISREICVFAHLYISFPFLWLPSHPIEYEGEVSIVWKYKTGLRFWIWGTRNNMFLSVVPLPADLRITSNAVIATQYCNTPFSRNLHAITLHRQFNPNVARLLSGTLISNAHCCSNEKLCKLPKLQTPMIIWKWS